MKNIKNNLKLKELAEALRKNLKRRKMNNKKTINEKNLVPKFKKFILIIILSTGLISCGKKIERVGYFLSDDKLNTIKVNETSEDNLLTVLGEPTAKSNFGPKIYYYMERQYEQIGFFTPRLTQQKIVAIEFNQRNYVKKITTYNKDDANLLKYDSNQVIIQGNKIGVLEQFVGNIGKFNSKAEMAKK
jgi:outer membrane protein assembly factor BamE (lipoprotein component of BamABCDE complex)